MDERDIAFVAGHDHGTRTQIEACARKMAEARKDERRRIAEKVRERYDEYALTEESDWEQGFAAACEMALAIIEGSEE